MSTNSIKTRLLKLEAASKPKINPLANLTEAELEERHFLTCQRLYGAGLSMGEEHLNALCRMSRLRQFAKTQPWLTDYNHRLDVFSGFRQRTIGQSVTNKERIDLIFCLGCRGVEIPPDDIEWMMIESEHIDLGDEAPWLREYLEGSGLSNGSTVKTRP